MMNENKSKVVSWISFGMDYYNGIDLLVEITGKQQFRGQFNGGMKHMSGKLAYEICKASGVADIRTWKQFIQDIKDGPVKSNKRIIILPPTTQENIPVTGQHKAIVEENKIEIKEITPFSDHDRKEASLTENPLKEYPSIIRHIIYEYASLYQERSKLHSVMTEMDPSNAIAVMQKRAELFDLIKELSVKLDKLYVAKENFELDGTLPIEAELFPVEESKHEEDINLLDEETLKTRKKNLQNGNSKDQSFLDYQSAKHEEVRNPMPKGPKRTKIEYRMKQRIKLMEDIDNTLLKYVIKQ